MHGLPASQCLLTAGGWQLLGWPPCPLAGADGDSGPNPSFSNWGPSTDSSPLADLFLLTQPESARSQAEGLALQWNLLKASLKRRKEKASRPKLYSPQDLEGSPNCFPSTRLAVCSSPHLLLLCRYCLETHTQGIGTQASAETAGRKTDEKGGAKEQDKTRG